jgi:hypothetical protein
VYETVNNKDGTYIARALGQLLSQGEVQLVLGAPFLKPLATAA